MHFPYNKKTARRMVIQTIKKLFTNFCAFCVSSRRCVFVTSMYVLLTVLFLYIFKAEGFEKTLLIWEGTVSILIFAVFGTKSAKHTKVTKAPLNRDASVNGAGNAQNAVRVNKNESLSQQNEQAIRRHTVLQAKNAQEQSDETNPSRSPAHLSKKNASTKAIAHIKTVCKVLLVVSATSGVLALLIQLGSSQRSLAEAWMEAARRGSPFGFFSFFAAEIYAVLLLPAVYAAAVRKHTEAVCILFSVNALCIAIIFASQALLVTACIFVLLPILRGKKWQPFLLPLTTSVVCAAVFALGFVNDKIAEPTFWIDVSPIMNMVAPDFPLMVHIPGYGYSLGGTAPQNSVSLSPRVIFSVHGKPNKTYYFTDNRIKYIAGESGESFWKSDLTISVEGEEGFDAKEYIDGGDASSTRGGIGNSGDASSTRGGIESSGAVSDVRVYFTPMHDASLISNPAIERLTLTLQDDFFSVIPLIRDTVAVEFEPQYKESFFERTDGGAVSVVPSLTKGAVITLFNDTSLSSKNADRKTPVANGEDSLTDRADTDSADAKLPQKDYSTIKGANYTEKTESTPSHISPKIIALANELYENACSLNDTYPIDEENAKQLSRIQERYVQSVLNYLKDGFTYSLKSPSAPSGTDPYEYFLFTSKTGFCTWYATCFALLMQAKHIPCRMAEGYLINLDQNGNGKISGMNAHAWAEVNTNGTWRIIEATPIYTADDPFSFINEGDKRTQKLVATALDTVPQKEERHFWLYDILRSKRFIKAFTVVVLLLVTVFFAFGLLVQNSPVQKARKAVRYYRKKGIAPPQETGWLTWKESVSDYAKTECAKKKERTAKKPSPRTQNAHNAVLKRAQNALRSADAIIERTYGE